MWQVDIDGHLAEAIGHLTVVPSEGDSGGFAGIRFDDRPTPGFHHILHLIDESLEAAEPSLFMAAVGKPTRIDDNLAAADVLHFPPVFPSAGENPQDGERVLSGVLLSVRRGLLAELAARLLHDAATSSIGIRTYPKTY